MGTQVKNSDLFSDDLFKGTKKDAESFAVALDVLEKSLKNILETSTSVAQTNALKNFADIKEYVKAINKAENSIEGLNKIQEERIKIEKLLEEIKRKEQQQATRTRRDLGDETRLRTQIIQGTDDEVRGRLRLQRAQRRQREELRDLIIMEDQETGRLERLQTANRQLVRQRRDLTEDTENYTEVLADLNSQIDANNEAIRGSVDAQAQQRMNIGNYTASVESAIEQSGVLGDILSRLDEITGGLGSQLIEMATNTEDSGDSAEQAGGRFKKFGKILKGLGIGAIIAVVSSIGTSLMESRAGQDTFEKWLERVTSLLTLFGSAVISQFSSIGASFDNFSLKIQRAFTYGADALKGLDDQIAKNNETISKSVAVWDDFLKKYSEVNDNADDIRKGEYELNDIIAERNIEIAKLIAQEEAYQQVADNSTKTFQEQEDAQRSALVTAQQRLKIQKEIATLEVDKSVLEVRNQLLKQGEDISIQEIKSLNFLKDRNLAMKGNTELINQLSEALVELRNIESEYTISSLEANRTLREIERDRFERNLDYAIDAFDAVKTVNEARISSDAETLESQQIIADKTKALAGSSFAEQIKLVQNYTGQIIDLQSLVEESDERVIRARLSQYKLDDILLGRILEIIKERKFITQDLSDLENDISEKVLERTQKELTARQALAEFRKSVDVTLAEEALAKEKDAGAKRLKLIEELQILQIQAEMLNRMHLLTNQELIEDERQRIIEESEEEIRKIKNKSLELQTKNAKDAQKEQAELLKRGTAILSSVVQKRSKERIDIIDRELRASEKRVNQLEDFARNSVELTTDNLAYEQKKQAELQAKREKEIQRQKREELGLTALKIYASKLGSGDKNSLGSTISDITLLTSFINALPSFYEGTNENTVGEVLGKPHFSGKDGYMVRVDKDETILSPQKTKEYHNMLDTGAVGRVVLSQDNTVLVDRLDSIERAISSKPVYLGRDYDATERAIVDKIEYKNKRIRTHKKTGGLF